MGEVSERDLAASGFDLPGETAVFELQIDDTQYRAVAPGRTVRWGWYMLRRRSLNEPPGCALATPPEIVERIVELRRQLTADGLDAGADTIAWHLQHHHHVTVSRATIYRILNATG